MNVISVSLQSAYLLICTRHFSPSPRVFSSSNQDVSAIWEPNGCGCTADSFPFSKPFLALNPNVTLRPRTFIQNLADRKDLDVHILTSTHKPIHTHPLRDNTHLKVIFTSQLEWLNKQDFITKGMNFLRDGLSHHSALRSQIALTSWFGRGNEQPNKGQGLF